MQILVSGLIFGCVYGLVALGLVLIFRTTGVVNFAHGEMAMVSTFIGYMFLSHYELPYYAAFLLTMSFSAVFGALVYLFFVKHLNQAAHLSQLVLTLGLFMVLHGTAGLVWGHRPAGFPQAISGAPLQLGGVFVTPNDMFILGVTFLLAMALFLLFRYTWVGLAMRASSQDLTSARLMGINVNMVYMVTWGAGSVLGAVAGLLAAPSIYLSVTMMFNVLIMAFAAAVLAGFASLPGAVLGGMLIGVLRNLVRFYWSPKMALIATFLLIVVILYIRPQGIFGGRQAVKKV
jgi:branched-chain amino acid transport system permease protein